MSELPRSAEDLGSQSIRALSPRAALALNGFGGLAESLARDPGFRNHRLLRPHPLLFVIRRGGFLVVVAPAPLWDHGRELLQPYLHQFGAVEARLVLLGRPADPDLNQALNLGLCALLAEPPSVQEVFVAVHQAFELMTVRARR